MLRVKMTCPHCNRTIEAVDATAGVYACPICNGILTAFHVEKAQRPSGSRQRSIDLRKCSNARLDQLRSDALTQLDVIEEAIRKSEALAPSAPSQLAEIYRRLKRGTTLLETLREKRRPKEGRIAKLFRLTELSPDVRSQVASIESGIAGLRNQQSNLEGLGGELSCLRGLRNQWDDWRSKIEEEIARKKQRKEKVTRLLDGIKRGGASLGWISGILLVAAVGFFLAALFLLGAASVSARVMPIFSAIAWFAVALDALVFLPMAIPESTRRFSSIAILFSSYIFGLTLWMGSLLLCYMLWGLWTTVFGLFWFGIGVVPIALLATLIEGRWAEFLTTLVLLSITLSSYYGALSLTKSLQPED